MMSKVLLIWREVEAMLVLSARLSHFQLRVSVNVLTFTISVLPQKLLGDRIRPKINVNSVDVSLFTFLLNFFFQLVHHSWRNYPPP